MELIELYRQHPCLWDVTKEVYRDRDRRTSAIREITANLKQIGGNMKGRSNVNCAFFKISIDEKYVGLPIHGNQELQVRTYIRPNYGASNY